MKVSKFALIRYRVIDRALKSSKGCQVMDLQLLCSEEISAYANEQIKVSRRTIFYDLAFMKDEHGFNAPIEHDKLLGYRYGVDGFSIFNIPLKQNELSELKHIISTLKRICGQEQFAFMDSILSRLESVYNLNFDENEKPILYFEHSHNILGQRWVSSLKEHIVNQQALQVNYSPFDQTQSTRFISPYVLKEYNNRWFLFGYDHDTKNMTVLGLDRIQHVAPSLLAFQIKDFDLDVHLQHVIGVSISVETPIESIQFWALGSQRHYVNTKPLHESQKLLKSSHKGDLFELTVIPNYELESQLLAFGETIEVVKPASLRKKLAWRINQANRLYVNEV